MPINLPIHINPFSFPSGYCPATWNVFVNDLTSRITGYVEGTYNLFNYGPTAPTDPNDRLKPWLKLDGSGFPVSWYVYVGGTVAAWVWPHEIAASSAFRQIFTGPSTDIDTLDGGEAGAVTDSSGPFWAIDSAFEARSPMGVAAVIPGTATAFPVTTNYGEAQHTLTTAEMPSHTHSISATPPTYDINGASTRTLFGTGDYFTTTGNTGAAGSGGAHNNVHPVYAVYFLKRTARIYRRAT